MLYTLNIYSGMCQLFLNKTGEKNPKVGSTLWFPLTASTEGSDMPL